MTLVTAAGATTIGGPLLSNATASASTETGPTGVLTGVWKLAEDNQTAGHFFFAPMSIATRTTPMSISYDAKADERDRIMLEVNIGNAEFTSTAQVYFDLDTGVIEQTDLTDMTLSGAASITALGSGWYRCAYTCLIDTTQVTQMQFDAAAPVVATAAVYTAIDNSGPEYNYLGTTGSGVLLTRPVWSPLWTGDADVATPIAGFTAQSIVKATRSSGSFTTADVGRYLMADGDVLFINGFRTPSIVTAIPTTTLAAETYPSWGIGRTTIDGLDALEGEAVSVVADGVVVASPYNPEYDPIVVTDGEIDIPEPAVVVTVGLPIVTDVQTLDLDYPNTSRLDSAINVTRIGLWLEDSVPPFAANQAPTGNSVATMNRMLTTDAQGTVTTGTISGYREVQIDGAFTRGGRIFLRQVDPEPLTVLAIIPQGHFPR